MSFISRIFKKEYSHFFIYKWSIFASFVEVLLIVLATFSMTNLYTILSSSGSMSNSIYTMVFSFYLVLFVILTCFIVFGMPLYLIIKKRAFSTAFLMLLMTMAFIFVFFTALLLVYLM